MQNSLLNYPTFDLRHQILLLLMSVNTNRELALLLQSGDTEAFNTLYCKYHTAIYYNVFKITRDLAASEDIVQEVFICLWEKRLSIDAEQDIAGWLFVVSYNKSVSHLKQQLKESLAQTAIQQSFEDIDTNYDVKEDQLDILERAIEQLSPQKRRVFELCKLERRTYLETAQELDISKHTVKEYLSSAVVSIKEYIRQHPEHAVVFACTIAFERLLS